MKLKLHAAWSQRLKLRAEGDKLWAEGSKLRAEGDKLRAEGDKLWAEGSKLRAEGDKLRAEGDKLWAEAIIEAYGNIKIEWSWKFDHGECTLENGDRYDADQGDEKKSRETLEKAATMELSCAEINYGNGTAKMWGKFSEGNAERFFMAHANQCFGIRKSISDFKLVALVPCEKLPDPWSKMQGAATVLSHNGDVIVWGDKGEKIKGEWD